MITFKKIDNSNWEDCISLSVKGEQKGLVASNAYSLVQAAYQKNCVPLGIYFEETMVGFAMYALDPDENSFWIYRLMISAENQGKNYGKLALIQLIEYIKNHENATQISLSYKHNNTVARKLYASCNFLETREVIEGEIVARLNLK
ncbi:MAG: GNAT family N-acetyltransferase [Oligoflexia bacterium]|nr:GNAT family N-acetyltransferase [Oligoflexia bacterium]